MSKKIKKENAEALSIVNQNLRQIDADLLTAYQSVIAHLLDMKKVYLSLKKELEEEEENENE